MNHFISFSVAFAPLGVREGEEQKAWALLSNPEKPCWGIQPLYIVHTLSAEPTSTQFTQFLSILE